MSWLSCPSSKKNSDATQSQKVDTTPTGKKLSHWGHNQWVGFRVQARRETCRHPSGNVHHWSNSMSFLTRYVACQEPGMESRLHKTKSHQPPSEVTIACPRPRPGSKRLKVPKLWHYNGSQDAKELANFLFLPWSVLQGGASRIRWYGSYNGKMCVCVSVCVRRRQALEDTLRGRSQRHRTHWYFWGVDTGVEEPAHAGECRVPDMEKLRRLRQTKSIQQHVKEFSNLMIDIHDINMGETLKIHRWTQTFCKEKCKIFLQLLLLNVSTTTTRNPTITTGIHGGTTRELDDITRIRRRSHLRQWRTVDIRVKSSPQKIVLINWEEVETKPGHV